MDKEINEQQSYQDSNQTEEDFERLIDKELEGTGDNEDMEEEEDPLYAAQQRAIDEELRRLREELEVDSTSPDVLEYDISTRVKLLNEELAKEGPAEEKKNRKVNFPENIVSMAVPPEEYPESPREMSEERDAGREGEEQSSQEDGRSLNGRGNASPVLQDGDVGERDEQGDHPDGMSTNLPNRTDDGGDVIPQTSSNGISDAATSSLSNDVGSPMITEQNTPDMNPDIGKDDRPPQTASGAENPQTEAGADKNGDSLDPNDLEVAKLTLNDEPQGHDGSGELSNREVSNLTHADKPLEQNDNNNQNNRTFGTNQKQEMAGSGPKTVSEDEHVLLERGGKFFYVNVQDLTPEEREMLGVKVAESPRPAGQESGLPVIQPRPPMQPRPATATGSGSKTVRQRTVLPQRSQSARTSREADKQDRKNALYEEPFGNARSKYGMTPEQKEFKREQMRLRAQRMREERDREEQDKREKEEIAASAFKAWLDKKKEDASKKRQEEKQKRREHEETKYVNLNPRSEDNMRTITITKEERFPEEAFVAWLERKKTQKRDEAKVKRRLTEEERNAYFMRSRTECEQAFKEWLRSKNAGLREERSMKRAGALESKKIAQQSRKSRNLAKALQIAQTYRYTEYYGYRF